ncbi:MAG: tetratricopeptide repeat-containing sensor histidine kinase [Dysgonamonadaceae bacterium]|jgi:signal transduction histidine kinase|nr:tetratricopeptide repeat-containing sensor histidine kinase [Dysgonamonadaceae bacterium]
MKTKNLRIVSVVLLLLFGFLLFATGCSSPRNNDDKQRKIIIVPDTVFASPSDSMEWVVNHVILPVGKRMQIYERLCWHFKGNDPQKAIHFGKSGLDLLKIEVVDSLKILLNYNLASVYIDICVFDSAKIHLEEALQHAKKIEDENREASVYLSYGRLYSKMNNDSTAIEYYEKVIRLAEKVGNYLTLSNVLANIAIKHHNNGNDEQAEKYLLRAYETYQTKVDNKDNRVLAHIYFIFSDIYLVQKRYEEALENAQKSLEYAQLGKSKYCETEALLELAQIHSVYTHQYNKALELAFKALPIIEELGNNFSKKRCLHIIGDIYYHRNDFSNSKIYYVQSLDLTSPDDLEGRKLALRSIMKSLIKLKETDAAIDVFTSLDSLGIALNNINIQNTLSELQVRYETEKKEQEIEHQQQIIARQNMKRMLLTGGIALSGVILILLWFLLRLRIRHNRTLIDRNNILTEMNATKDKFFSIISHDLRNPAIMQRDALQLLIKNVRLWDVDTVTDYYHELLKSAEGQVELLYNLLNWAQIQTGRMTFSPNPFAFSMLIPDITLLRKMAENKGVEFDLKIPYDAIVTADSNILSAIIRNLLTNAIKFTEKGGTVSLEITACGDVARGDVAHNVATISPIGKYTITVTDTGIGMNEEQLKYLFQLDSPYHSKGTADEQGSGLGLIVCKELLEKHESVLHVESEKGKGSRFWFEI